MNHSQEISKASKFRFKKERDGRYAIICFDSHLSHMVTLPLEV